MVNEIRKNFEEVYEQTSGKLRSYIYCMCHDRGEIDDLLQECYFRALNNWKQFRGQGSREGWLFGIARKICIDWCRTNKSRDLQPMDNLEGSGTTIKAENVSDEVENVWCAINELNEDYKQVMYLRFAGELSYQEISESLGIPVGTVRSRLHRALKEVRERLKRLK